MISSSTPADEIVSAIERYRVPVKPEVLEKKTEPHIGAFEKKFEQAKPDTLEGRVEGVEVLKGSNEATFHFTYMPEEEYHAVEEEKKRLPKNRLALEVKDYIFYIKFRTLANNMRNLNPSREIASWMEANGATVARKLK